MLGGELGERVLVMVSGIETLGLPAGDQVATTVGHLLARSGHHPGRFSILFMFTWALLTYGGDRVG